VEGGDLAVVDVGGDEGCVYCQRCGARGGRDAQPLEVVLACPKSSPTVPSVGPPQAEVVSNIAGHPAELAAHLGHQEGHVQDVHFVGQDVLLELVGEHHDGVIGQRSTNQGGHALLTGVIRTGAF
jgi:hypothetical protein